jgi:serine/threonine-protein phosphatase 4 regulatory subunit 4
LQLCAALLVRFSCRFFKENFLGLIMLLLVDVIPNVRLTAVALLPALKQTIRLPEDVEQLVCMGAA